MELKSGAHLFFLCDRKACGETCPNESCSHTGDIRHAKNFDSVEVNADGLVDFFEVEIAVQKNIGAKSRVVPLMKN